MISRSLQKRGHSLKKSRSRDANWTLPETLTGSIIGFLHQFEAITPKELYLKQVFLEKFVSKDTDPSDVRAQRAINKWLSVERDNDATNTRLLQIPGEYNILPRVTWASFIAYAQGLVAKILGETVPIEALNGAFSGGATVTRSRTESHPALKYLGEAGITSPARKWFDLVMEESPLWSSHSSLLTLTEWRGNVMFTVPKSTTIDRCACKEPDLNMYLQKGVGNYIRRRLRHFKINLNDQSVNQELARKGSIDDSLATIDLSSASDSVSMACVELLLPPLWFGLLSDLRSPETFVQGEWHKNAMFSSMGNGFTFELESLIFYALARSVRHFTRGSGVISVYGDDIIVGSDYAWDLVFVLGMFGFSVNTSKSFFSGPFRESCGGHYWNGSDISPFYVRRPLSRVRDAIILANQIRKWSQVEGISILDDSLYDLWVMLKNIVPPQFWGGVNLESDSQLVSHDTPNKRLMSVKKRFDTELGGYLLWMDTCKGADGDDGTFGFSSRCGDAVITSERTVEQTVYEARRIKGELRRTPFMFLKELEEVVPVLYPDVNLHKLWVDALAMESRPHNVSESGEI